MEAGNLPHTEFKTLFIRVLEEFRTATKRDGMHKKGHRNHKKEPDKSENMLTKMQNTLEGINNRLGEAEDQIRDLEDNVEKTPQKKSKKNFFKRGLFKGLLGQHQA